MSRRRKVQPPREDPRGKQRQHLVLVAAALAAAVFLGYYLLQARFGGNIEDWPTATGTITETRISAHPATSGSAVQLQPEICVSYQAGEKTEVRWFPLPGTSDRTQSELEARMKSLEGAYCTVHWRPGNPADAYVTEVPPLDNTKP